MVGLSRAGICNLIVDDAPDTVDVRDMFQYRIYCRKWHIQFAFQLCSLD